MKKRKHRQQVAALPYWTNPDGKLELLLITSRDTGRWVLPKGWPMKGRRPHEAARIEAFEEAGIDGKIGKKAVGEYHYDKDGELPCRVRVYPLSVAALREEWPEMAQRRREWHCPAKAAELVDERDLKALLRSTPAILDLSSGRKD
ncbi:NUDIX hydrolase [Jiella pacifica]|uniref:NUDIX domain-containing protein n=1 Tax=Jiella pacifica TaxID=2696469 RepID=A0A6N9T9E4_9HYPH|nr:NUDIX hydrolase [Jiella pacifica]NDW07162.1 NUDIX domain-containing protein [Jiella pacifica]